MDPAAIQVPHFVTANSTITITHERDLKGRRIPAASRERTLKYGDVIKIVAATSTEWSLRLSLRHNEETVSVLKGEVEKIIAIPRQ